MPIEVKELIVRAWIDSQGYQSKQEKKKVAKTGSEISEMQAQLLEQLMRKMTDKKDR